MSETVFKTYLEVKEPEPLPRVGKLQKTEKFNKLDAELGRCAGIYNTYVDRFKKREIEKLSYEEQKKLAVKAGAARVRYYEILKEMKSGKDAGNELDEKAKEYARDHGISYSDACVIILGDDEKLAKQYI